MDYDYLLIGLGSEYPAPFKPSREEPTLASRCHPALTPRCTAGASIHTALSCRLTAFLFGGGRKATWHNEYKKLEAARSVIVVGGGLVGTEVVGEILTAYPDTTVTVVDGFSQCCANLPTSTVRCFFLPHCHPNSHRPIMTWQSCPQMDGQPRRAP